MMLLDQKIMQILYTENMVPESVKVKILIIYHRYEAARIAPGGHLLFWRLISMNHTIRPILVILYALLEIITGGDER